MPTQRAVGSPVPTQSRYRHVRGGVSRGRGRPTARLATSGYAVLAAVAVALSACTVHQTERPGNNYSSASPEPVPTLQEVAGAPQNRVVDASPGGPRDQDPVWQGLAQSVENTQDIYLDVMIHTGGQLGEGDTVTLTPDAPDSVSITVPAQAVTSPTSGFYRITGTFSVEELGASAYSLQTVSTAAIDGLIPGDKNLADECSHPEAQNRIGLAAQTLANNPDQREDLRRTWISVPELWWAIQSSAILMRKTNGETEGDFFLQACESVLN